ncbi:MAG: flagellar hook capping FlgD N-terminal domain-containing protein [Paracoccaceae bacterium]|nr:flagellar hook capping FlgD N-terminal domain-containing protein [Paracoccaceae bacterium]
MDVASTTSAATSATAATAAVEEADETQGQTDFDIYLQLLTTQLQNQDPTDPEDTDDFATDLATFSEVEQSVKTNDLLEEIAASLNSSSINQLADWVGHEARAQMPVAFDGAPITVAPDPAPGSDEMTLVVTNAFGSVVDETALPASSENITWAGVNEDGEPFPSGVYSFTLESRSDGTVTSVDDVEVYAPVREAQLVGDAVVLVFDGGVSIDADAVTALRDAEGAEAA